MKIDRYCQRRNCSPLNALFSDLYVTLISQSVHSLWGVRQVRVGENKLFSSNMRQYHSPWPWRATASALLQTSRSLFCNLFLRRIGAIVGMLCQRQLDFLVVYMSEVLRKSSWSQFGSMLKKCCRPVLVFNGALETSQWLWCYSHVYVTLFDIITSHVTLFICLSVRLSPEAHT